MQNVLSTIFKRLEGIPKIIKHKYETSRTILFLRGRSHIKSPYTRNQLINLVIVDPSLDGFLGHHYEYDMSAARAAIADGHNPIVLCKHNISSDISNDPLLVQTFNLDMWQKSPHADSWSDEDLLFCNRSFYVDLVRGLSSLNLSEKTTIFGHMLTSKQLLGWAWFLESLPKKTNYKIILLMRYEPSLYAGELADTAFRIFEKFAQIASLRLCSDSAKLAKTFDRVTSLPVEVFSIPHTKQISQSIYPAQVTLNVTQIRIICLGNPRQDKGILNFLEAIQIINTSEYGKRCKFVVQANDPGYGTQQELSNFMKDPPENTSFITELMKPDDYFSTLFQSDIVVLPYWKSVYEFRTSGVFVEAVCAGKIVVCSKDTWMADELRSIGAGLVCEEQNSASLVEAIISCIDNFDNLSIKAIKSAPKYAVLHNAQRLVQNIFENTISR